MPEWMKQQEDYNRIEHKAGYIIKNLNKFSSLLRFLRNEHNYNNNKDIEAYLRILFLIIYILCIVKSYSIYQLWICILFILIELSSNSGLLICSILKKSIVTFIFPFAMFIPYLFYGKINNSIFYLVKIFTVMLSVQIFISNTTIYDITKSLKKIYCPNIIIFIMDIMIKYLNITTYLIYDILQAIIIRNIGIDNNKYNTIGGLFANVFIKITSCGEDIYNAMECRGFTDKYVNVKSKYIKKNDVLYIFKNIIFLIIYYYIDQLI